MRKFVILTLFAASLIPAMASAHPDHGDIRRDRSDYRDDRRDPRDAYGYNDRRGDDRRYNRGYRDDRSAAWAPRREWRDHRYQYNRHHDHYRHGRFAYRYDEYGRGGRH
jgi:hypothetical protein